MVHTEARSPSALAAIASHLCRFAPGDVICREGEPCEYAYLVRTGEIELRILGRPKRLHRGAVFGEQVLLGTTESVGTAIATRGSELVRLGADDLDTMLREAPEVAAGMMRALAERIAQPLHHPPADTEVIRQLVGQLALQVDPRQDPPRAHTNLRELAGACGVDLPAAHRALAALFDRKLLYLAEDDLIIPDLAALEALRDGA